MIERRHVDERDERTPNPAGSRRSATSSLGLLGGRCLCRGPAPRGSVAQAGRRGGRRRGRSSRAAAEGWSFFPEPSVALVDQLERDGLLDRRRNPRDRRHHALHLTDAGRARLRELGRIAQEHGADFLTPLDDTERATLGALLARLADHHGLKPGVHPGYRTLGRPREEDAG